jgi:hypothetical protein
MPASDRAGRHIPPDLERSINPFLPSLFFGALLLAATQSFADDTVQSGAMTTQQHQMLKDCMARQKAKDAGMSTADTKSVCIAQMKSKMNTDQTNSSQMSGDQGNSDDQPTGGPPATSPPKQ